MFWEVQNSLGMWVAFELSLEISAKSESGKLGMIVFCSHTERGSRKRKRQGPVRRQGNTQVWEYAVELD